MPDGISSSTNGSSLQQQEMSLIHDRNLPSSPNPLYSPHSKTTGFMKAGIGQPAIRKQLMGGHAVVDNSRGLIQWVHSISFVAVSMEHSLQLLLQADSPSPGKISYQYLTYALFSSIDVFQLHLFLFNCCRLLPFSPPFGCGFKNFILHAVSFRYLVYILRAITLHFVEIFSGRV